jgi:hypothetical protein
LEYPVITSNSLLDFDVNEDEDEDF